MRFLIDGYNLLHAVWPAEGRQLRARAWPRFRQRLLDRLRDRHATRAGAVTVVFDAKRSPPRGGAEEDLGRRPGPLRGRLLLGGRPHRRTDPHRFGTGPPHRRHRRPPSTRGSPPPRLYGGRLPGLHREPGAPAAGQARRGAAGQARGRRPGRGGAAGFGSSAAAPARALADLGATGWAQPVCSARVGRGARGCLRAPAQSVPRTV